MDKTLVKTLYDARMVAQKQRVRLNNQIEAIKRGDDVATPDALRELEGMFSYYAEQEEHWTDRLVDIMKDNEIVQRVQAVKGIGPTLAAKMVAMIDIHRDDTPSALWRYAGFAVVDGKAERKTKGQKLKYNQALKTTMYVVATSFLRANSPYRREYDEAREYYELNRPDWTPAHKHQAAIRKMVKLFLFHLWKTWRQIEGLSIGDPYIIGKDGHEHVKEAVEYGWEPVDVAV